MSRRGRSRRPSESIADAVLSQPLTPSRLLRDLARPSDFRDVEDRRTYHPLDFFRPARDFGGHPVEQVNVNRPVQKKFSRVLPFGLKFAAPERTVICAKRKSRKEVLHALKKTGKGKGRRKPRFNWYSKIGC